MKKMLVLATVLAVFIGVGGAFAQSIWIGGGNDTNWQTANNWQGGVAPVSPASLTFSGTSVANSNDYADATQFNGITFAAGASAFTLSGNAINLGGDVVNLSSNTQIVSLSLALLQNSTLNSSGAALTINKIISGSGGITKIGASGLLLGASNTYTGPTVVQRGTLTINNVGGISSSSSLIMGGLLTSRDSATLTRNGIGGSTQTFNGTTFKAGRSVVSLGPRVSGSGVVTVDLGAITRESPATAAFTTGNSTVRIATSNGNTNGILGGWAYSGQNWATVNGTGHIEGYSGYTTPMGLNPTVANGAANNIQITNTNDFTLTGNMSYNSNILRDLSDVSGLSVGDPVTAWASDANADGSGELKIPAGSVITAINGNNVTISEVVVRGTGGAQSATNTTTAITMTFAKPMTMAAGGTTDVNTVMITDLANRVVNIGTGNTLRLGATGGIWRSTASVNHSDRNSLIFEGGSITAGGANNTAGEIVFRPDGSTTTDSSGGASRPSPGIIVNSTIVDNGSGAVRVIKDGEQTVRFSQANSYSGGTYILRGRIALTGTGTLGSGDVYLFDDPTNYSGGSVGLAIGSALSNNFYVVGTGMDGGGAVGMARQSSISGNITLLGNTTIGGSGDNTLGNASTISGRITGVGNLNLGGSGAFVILSNSSNDLAGNIQFADAGSSGSTSATLRLNAAGALGNGTSNLTLAKTGSGNPSVTVDLRGNNQAINGLFATGNTSAQTKILLQSSTGSAILTLGSLNGNGTYNGTIQNGGGTLGLKKVGSGTQILSGINTYGGATTVENGTLDITGTLTGTAGDVTITGGIFAYSNAAALNRNVIIDGGTFRHTSAANYNGTLTFTSGRLAGTNWNGNLSGLTIGDGQIVAPGSSPGSATTANQTWAGGGSLEFEINAATGTAGVNWDKLTLTDTLDISALSPSNKFTIELVSLDGSNNPGLLAGFDKTNFYGYNWEFAGFATLNGTYAVEKFTVDTSGFQNDFSGGGFVVTQSGNSLYVSYIPEPATVGMALGGLALLLLRRRTVS